jgi:hypothetical protein
VSIRPRALARRALGVRRASQYYLPWIARPGLTCKILVNNVEARFKTDARRGPFHAHVVQHDADGRIADRHRVTLADVMATAEVELAPAPGGCGIATVTTEGIDSDLYVALSDGDACTVTHGRGEWVETYPRRTRALLDVLGGALRVAGRTVPAFAKDQYAYVGGDHASHLLVMNLSNVTNRIRIAATRLSVHSRSAPASPGRSERWGSGGHSGPPVPTSLGARLIAVPPMGARLVDVAALGGPTPSRTEAWRLRVEGNAWFNFYLVGVGARGLEGPLSLMHVK